jgi:hypothetical protein
MFSDQLRMKDEFFLLATFLFLLDLSAHPVALFLTLYALLVKTHTDVEVVGFL